MSNNQIVELQTMISTADNSNEIVEKLKAYIDKVKSEKRVNWQMLACYLDGKIFEFIQANRGNEIHAFVFFYPTSFTIQKNRKPTTTPPPPCFTLM
jgi:hypothetical protein